ncbi:MAG: hypothetical protein FWF50_06355 [Defluviitaleaceae bacterium]|nr:hypothetical protein [Defluviitaleaceae bacterium]
MNEFITKAYLKGTEVKETLKREAQTLKQDTRGMELLQIIIIILIVVIIAAALWAFLGPWITNMINSITEGADSMDDWSLPGSN